MLEKLLTLDRRWIFLVIGAAVAIPLFTRPSLPVEAQGPAKAFFREIESLPEGAPILVSFDFDAASQPELLPMGEAVLRHAFRKNLRVVVMTLWVTGLGITDGALDRVAKKEYNKEYGKDYVFLGWKAGNETVILGMGQNLREFFPADNYGKPTGSMPVLRGINSLKDFALIVSLSAGYPGNREWVQHGVARYGFKLSLGVTGVILPEVYPYLGAGQVKGLLGGIKGAAEYEGLLQVPGTGMGGMAALSFAHFVLIGLIIACNVLYFLSRRKGA